MRLPASGPNSRRGLSRFLQSLFLKYDRNFLPHDPVFFVHQYADPRDQEIVGLISALLAFGNVKAIHRSLQNLLKILGKSPAQSIAAFDGKMAEEVSGLLGHRWVRGADLHRLFGVFRTILGNDGSLKSFFLKEYEEGDEDISSMLHRISLRMRSLAGEQPMSRGFRYFFPSPADGSPCKRLNMFLRWMVRPKDGLDLGLWTEIPASKLIVPLDIHLYRFGRKFRLSRIKTPNWRFACDVTRFLKTLDPEDPVKYDFAICHYGMEVGW